jgi:hypothetical protein
MTTRREVLETAMQLIHADRAATYGEPADNLNRIAKLWSVLFDTPITARQVAWAMALVKIGREVHGTHPDNPIDVAGYAAIAGEL